MKRSKIIELIFKRLGPIGVSEPTCEEVLAIVEEAGMLPSKIKIVVPYDAWNGIDAGIYEIDAHKWSEE